MLISASLLLAGVALPLPLAAQGMVQPLPGTTDADKLADLVRQLGRSPRDLDALIEAGDLSAKLGDTTAAAALYKRAALVDPNNARVKAGVARILVNGEHPGEALRYFDQAERGGLSPTMFAGDRGLAYDLIGEQERAQRDYRIALARSGQEDEDEVRRRYALSLGISGRKDEALQQIDALLRKSDRGAWRARAFILAMNGDASGANRIATTMMPAGMAGGLSAFFTRLPTLSPADRAFAVHFGEVSPTLERIADARLVPPLPALAPDPYARSAPVQVAAQSVLPPQNARDRRRGREPRGAAQPNARGYATSTPQPAVLASAATQPASPYAGAAATSLGSRSPATLAQSRSSEVAAMRPVTPAPSTSAPQVAQPSDSATASYAASGTWVAPGTTPAATANRAIGNAPPQIAQGSATPSYPTADTSAPTGLNVAASPQIVSASTPTSAAAANLSVAAETRTVVPGALASLVPAGSAAPTAAASANDMARAQSPSAIGVVQATPAPSVSVQTIPVAPTQVASVTAPSAATPPRAPGEDTILARIVANIAIPASELGVAPMPGATPQSGTNATIDDAAVAAERNAAAIQRRRDRAEVASAEPTAAHLRRGTASLIAAAQADEAVPGRGRHDASVETAVAQNDEPAPNRKHRGAVTQAAAADPVQITRGRGTHAEPADDEPASNPRRRGAKAREQLARAEVDTPSVTTRRGKRSSTAKDDTELAAATKPVSKKAKTSTAADRKAAADEKAARAEPERYWIQVAGGATEGDLNKAWSSAKAKSSLLAGRKGYSTPLRATNRVVTGPFKSQAEAQAMVNKLSKQDVSAFTFTSEAGQKMTKLGGK